LFTVTVPSKSYIFQIVNHCDRTNLQLRLFQYQACPFCCKVRAFLDYYGFSYEVVEVNPVTKAQIKFSKDYKKVPILSSNDGTFTDSVLIVSKLATFLRNSDRELSSIDGDYPMIEALNDKNEFVKCYPQKYVVYPSKTQKSEEIAADREERQWREWVDGNFIHLISPNVYRSLSESLETFKWFSEYGEWDRMFTYSGRLLATYVGAFMMWLIAKRLKRRHNIDDERKAMAEAFEEWMNAIGPNREFMGGSAPNLADLGMYGAMTSFSGCAAFRDLVIDGSPIERWYSKMRNAVNNHEGRRLLEKRTTMLSK
ncbi:glutaredoxin, partial [Ancylostoma caninum]